MHISTYFTRECLICIFKPTSCYIKKDCLNVTNKWGKFHSIIYRLKSHLLQDTQKTTLHTVTGSTSQCDWLSAMSGNPLTVSLVLSNTISHLYYFCSVPHFFRQSKLAENPLKDPSHCTTHPLILNLLYIHSATSFFQ